VKFQSETFDIGPIEFGAGNDRLMAAFAKAESDAGRRASRWSRAGFAWEELPSLFSIRDAAVATLTG
jgi:hypothetical protein